LNAGDELVIRAVFRPSAGFGNQGGSVITVGGIPDSERFRDRIRFDRPDVPRPAPDGIDNRIASRRLSAVKPSALVFADESVTLKFFQPLVDFADHSATRHRDDDGIRGVPT